MRVVAGVAAARAAGLPLKTNAVALRGVNDGELAALCEFAWLHGATPRFIEHMPMSERQLYTAAAELHRRGGDPRGARGRTSGPLAAVARAPARCGPARYWATADRPRDRHHLRDDRAFLR